MMTDCESRPGKRECLDALELKLSFRLLKAEALFGIEPNLGQELFLLACLAFCLERASFICNYTDDN